MSPDERLQRIARRDLNSRTEVAWLIEQVVRLNSENARLTDKLAAVRSEVTNAEDGDGHGTLTARLRKIIGPR